MTDPDRTLPTTHSRLAGVRWLSGPALIFMLCFCGMTTGLAIDLQSISPATLASLCLGTHSLADSIVAHSALLPATNLFMLGGGVIAAGVAEPDVRRWSARRFGFYVGCCAAMLAGMLFGEWFGPRLAAGAGLSWDLSAMVAAMAAGMALGMAAVTALGRISRLARSSG